MALAAVVEHAAVVAAEEELLEAGRLQETFDYLCAAAALKRRDPAGNQGPVTLHDRLALAAHNLELETRLDAIRLDRVLTDTAAQMPSNGVGMRSLTPPGRKYEEVFRETGLGTVHDDPAKVAAHVAASPVRAALLADLDDWARVAIDQDQRAWVMAVAPARRPGPLAQPGPRSRDLGQRRGAGPAGRDSGGHRAAAPTPDSAGRTAGGQRWRLDGLCEAGRADLSQGLLGQCWDGQCLIGVGPSGGELGYYRTALS